MTTNDLMPRPPRWADALLRLLLRPEDRESVSGDLLEEYRDSIVPALGSKAKWWYISQVGGFLLRGSWMWGAAICATVIIRFLSDWLAPVTYTPGVMPPRQEMMYQTLMGIFGASAFWTTWRTTHIRAGVLIALVAGLIGGVLGGGVASIVRVGAWFWYNPQTMSAVQWSVPLGEPFVFMPMLLIPISLVSGVFGAIAAKGLSIPSRHRGRAAF